MSPAPLLRVRVLIVSLLVGCSSSAPRAAPATPAAVASAAAPPDAGAAAPLADQAVAGATDPALRALLADHWDATMHRYPTWATELGDHRFDDQLSDRSDAAVRAWYETERGFLVRARAIEPSTLAPDDRTIWTLFVEQLEADVGTEVCASHLWNVSAFDNAVSSVSTLPLVHVVRGARDAQTLVGRYRQIPAAVNAEIANLKLGLARGLTPGAEELKRAIALVDRQLATPVDKWQLAKPATSPPHGLDQAVAARLHDYILAVLRDQVRPAFTRYRDFLKSAEVPGARGASAEGLGSLPGGAACYAADIRSYTGLERTPEELHKLGLEEIARTDKELAALGKKLFGTASLPAIFEHLRTDKKLHFDNADEMMKVARFALAAAQAAVPKYFGIQPKEKCVVRAIPEVEAPFQTIAYYRQPHGDGSAPGEFYLNTYEPQSRPRFEMEVLVHHEAVPGHHLQIAIAQERPALPAFIRYAGLTAFVEGWALYAERLSDEMGLYTGDLDRVGMVSYDAWRAARLVVNTGIHSMGWSRAKAEAFMHDHTALADNNISNEVNRYIAWPGQALAYKVGQLEILRLREDAKKRLGDRFDLREFHDVVLGWGAVTLPVLADRVNAWVTAKLGSAR